jgi:hypothetical protein
MLQKDLFLSLLRMHGSCLCTQYTLCTEVRQKNIIFCSKGLKRYTGFCTWHLTQQITMQCIVLNLVMVWVKWKFKHNTNYFSNTSSMLDKNQVCQSVWKNTVFCEMQAFYMLEWNCYYLDERVSRNISSLC